MHTPRPEEEKSDTREEASEEGFFVQKESKDSYEWVHFEVYERHQPER